MDRSCSSYQLTKKDEQDLSILTHVAGILLSPFSLAVTALITVGRICRKLLSMVIGASLALALHRAADFLVRMIEGRAKFLSTIWTGLVHPINLQKRPLRPEAVAIPIFDACRHCNHSARQIRNRRVFDKKRNWI